MSDNPTRTFKDFIGWIFIGGASIIIALVSMIYSSLNAEVTQLDAAQRVQIERIKGAEVGIETIHRDLLEIKQEIRKANSKLDELKGHR